MKKYHLNCELNRNEYADIEMSLIRVICQKRPAIYKCDKALIANLERFLEVLRNCEVIDE